ncbi:protein DGCR6L isoform X6 [Pongo pygmaeus]|uniref:protein DGCR6L isoform X6 n=1 Tax=Pongo pygmaeus TaxID=9600 RepID=UPI00300D7BF6
MERYVGALEEVGDGARQQERHYQLLSALQSLLFPAAPVLHHAQRPGSGASRRHRVRNRAGAIGDPAPHRKELVQPAPAPTERASSAQAGAAAEAPGSPAGLPAPQPACTSGGSAARTRELPSPPPTPSPAPWQAVEHRIHEEQRAMDRKIVLELDRKVADQQSTLEKAGVAGFYVTTNPQLPTGGSPC